MVLFFPMAVLFAVMLLLVRMAKDNEITVLRSSGVSLTRILIPLLVLSVFASYLSFFTNEKIVPWANNVSDNLIRVSIQKTPPPDIMENIFFKDSDDRYFYINKVDSKKAVMENILIYELTRDYPRIISAKEAYWDSKTWYLKKGIIQDLDENGYLTYSAKFDVMMIRVDRDLQSFYSEQKTTREMDSKELKEKISILEKGGISTRNLKVEFFLKRSIPAACFIFALIGIAFCFLFVRSGKDWWGVILAVCISVLAVGFYFFIMAVCRSLGRSGVLDPILAAWLPNLIYGVLGFILILYEIYRR
jgi:lipopolysaccharide export system permease protein